MKRERRKLLSRVFLGELAAGLADRGIEEETRHQQSGGGNGRHDVAYQRVANADGIADPSGAGESDPNPPVPPRRESCPRLQLLIPREADRYG
jgi:hypothetical protein